MLTLYTRDGFIHIVFNILRKVVQAPGIFIHKVVVEVIDEILFVFELFAPLFLRFQIDEKFNIAVIVRVCPVIRSSYLTYSKSDFRISPENLPNTMRDFD